ncbi:cadherin-related family member 5 isoform X2 [Xenopus tropicalis]|uniref:Cadherin-related family member 5 isoform X2 n=1 Tax=Xenopus tropicalis TaxID=8364 RepID=A0A8J1JF32_XENTR|nr:cadherin-related family member 5 isoform X2 [Xenopus tropicalis]
MGSILALFILLFLPIGCMAQGCKVNNTRVEIPENNPVGYVVTTIQTDPGYSMTVSDNIEWFEIKGTQLLLKQSLDYETNTTHDVSLLCERGGTTENNIRVYVTVLNVNDNPPVFKYSTYTFTIPEDTKVNTPIGEAIEAEDLDLDRIFYVLTGPVQEAAFFRLTSINNPVILVNQNLDYEKFNHVQLILTARDTPTVGESPSHTATATININIEDLDNKPPQFLPCQIINGICINVGYTTKVNRSEKETGALVLQPGPLYAIDGDTGINTPIEYLVLAGNDAGIFAVDKFSGNITMTKAADTLGIIFLQIMAAQVNDGQKFATTSLTIDVVERNHHPPKFEKQNYFGTIQVQSATGTSVTDSSSPNRLLQVFAADEDFEDRMNPYITYTIQGTTDFSVSRNGFIKNDAVFNSPTKVAFTVLATDTVTREEDITNVEVEITPSVTTIVTTTTTTRTTAHGPGTTTTTTSGTGTTTSTLPGTGTTIITTSGTGTTTTTTPGTGTTTSTTPGTGTTTSTTPGTGTTTSTTPGTGTIMSTTHGTGTTTTTSPGTGTTTSTTHGTGTTTTTSPGTGTTTSTTHGTGTTTTTSPGTGTTTSTTHGTGTTTTTSPGTGTTTSTTHGTGTTTTTSPGTGTTTSTTPGTGTTTSRSPGTESTVGSGKGYSATDMAALGATLGVILALCLVGLGFLIHKQYGDQIRNRMRKSSGDDFGGSEDRTEQLIDDDDADDDPNPGSSDVMPTSISYDTDGNISKDPLVTDYLVLGASAANLFANENSSNIPNAEKPEEGSDSDDKKEVKSILTKEFKEDPGYKSVWFREDASPEVVVIDGVEEGEVDDGETEEEYNQEDDDDDDDEDDLSPDFLGMNNDSNNFSQL